MTQNDEPDVVVQDVLVDERLANQDHPLQELSIDINTLTTLCTDAVVLKSVNLLDGIAKKCHPIGPQGECWLMYSSEISDMVLLWICPVFCGQRTKLASVIRCDMSINNRFFLTRFSGCTKAPIQR